MQKQVATLFQKEMTRKEFVATLGFGVVSILGFGSILNALNGTNSSRANQSASRGYGSSSYGN